MRILLAEDDVSQAQSIKTWLEMDGYSIDWVERGDYAISAIDQHEYDCVLLDYLKPQAMTFYKRYAKSSSIHRLFF